MQGFQEMALFTVETAREMGLRSVEAKKQRALERQQQAQAFQEAPATNDKATDLFTDQRLARVRFQLSLIDSEIEKELQGKLPDGQRIDRLAAASMRLNDQEFALANRPKPAPLKMTSRSARQYQQPSTQPPPSATE